MTTVEFQNIHYQRIFSNDEDGDDEECSELPPAVVTTKGTEKNGRWFHFFKQICAFFN